MISLWALTNEYLGAPDSWIAAAPPLRAPPFSLPEEDATAVRWLDVFRQLIGNTDRHLGNLSFLVHGDGSLRVAPAYDMLPMSLAPSADVLVARRLEPAPPTATTLDVWSDAAACAQRFWREVRAHDELDPEVRRFAAEALDAISRLAERVSPAPPAPGRAT